MTGLTLRRTRAGVVLLVDGHAVTPRPVSEAQAVAAARELAGWRGASIWQDADGTEYVVERVGGPATTLEAQRGAAAVRLVYYGPAHTSGYARLVYYGPEHTSGYARLEDE